MTGSTLVRVRPASDPDLGRSLETVMAVLDEAFGANNPQPFSIEFLAEVPEEFEDLAELAETMMDSVDGGEGLLFIDADFQRNAARSYQVLDSFLGALLRQPVISDAGCHIYVTMEKLPRRVDQLFELTEEEKLRDRLLIIDGQEAFIGPVEMSKRITPVLSRYPAGSGPADPDLLRRRGVYRRAGLQETFYPFYFDPSSEAIDSFQKHLKEFLLYKHVDVLVSDSATAGPWFPGLVQAACLDLKVQERVDVRSVEVSDLNGEVTGDQRQIRPHLLAEIRDLVASDACLGIVVPAFATGRTLARALTAVGRSDAINCHLMAMLADEAAVTQVAGTKIVKWTHGRHAHPVQFIRSVPMPSLPSSHWIVRAAVSMGEVRDFPLDHQKDSVLTRVAAWSIVTDCGVGLESIPPGGRAPVKYYPNLQRISPWDAHLLGELAIQRVLELDPASDRSSMLVVVPDEDNGSRPIAAALRKRCKVAVSRVPRAVIDGEANLSESETARIRRHRSNTIVILDEATVSGGTLQRLQGIVESIVGYTVPMLGCVFDMSGRSAAPSLFSLSCWRAVARGEHS